MLSLLPSTNAKLSYLGCLLLVAGLPKNVLPWSLGQIHLESGGLTNRGSSDLNNYSGITYTDSGDQVNSVPDPSGSAFAKFVGVWPDMSWAKDYVRILSMGAASPINASSASEFGMRLVANGYTSTDRDTYANTIISLSEQMGGVADSSVMILGGVSVAAVAAASCGCWSLFNN